MQLRSALLAGTSSPSLAMCPKMAERRRQMMSDKRGLVRAVREDRGVEFRGGEVCVTGFWL